MAEIRARVAALIAAASIAAGTAAVTVALLSSLGPGAVGYVSEAGDPDSPYADAYRAGMYAVAAGLLLLGAALRPVAGIAAALLAVSAASTVLSATVPCTDGCPLPPHEPTTVADLVHAAASIIAVATCVFAMVAAAVAAGTAHAVRRLSGAAAAVALPLSVIVGLTILIAGRGPVVSVLERILLATAVLWAVTTATATGVDGAGTGSRPPAALATKDRR